MSDRKLSEDEQEYYFSEIEAMAKRLKGKESKLKKEQSDFEVTKKNHKRFTFTKKLIIVNYLFSWVCVLGSYCLAYLEKPQIAEGLATAIGVNILTATSGYLLKSYFETREEDCNKLVREGYVQDDVVS